MVNGRTYLSLKLGSSGSRIWDKIEQNVVGWEMALKSPPTEGGRGEGNRTEGQRDNSNHDAGL